MDHSRTKLSQKTERVVSDVCWRDCIDVIGTKPFAPNNNESRIAEAARVTTEGVRKMRRLFYEEVTDPKFSTGAKIINAAHKQADRLLAVAASLEAKDEEFFREEITRLRAVAHRASRPAG